MKKIITLLMAAMLMFSLSGQAMAYFENEHLIRIVWDNDTEIATDLGAGFDLGSPYNGSHLFDTNNFSKGLLGIDNWSAAKVAYFIVEIDLWDGLTYNQAWTSGPTTGQMNDRGMFDAFAGQANGAQAKNAQLGLAQNVYAKSDPNSFYSKFFGDSSFAGFLDVPNGSASLADLETVGYVTQYLYYYAPDADVQKAGIPLMSLTTFANGTTEINAADDYPELPQTDAISLDRPIEGHVVDASSLYNAMPFSWISREEFSRIELQFSADNFASMPVKIKKKGYVTETHIPSGSWKKILKLPGSQGGIVFWRVAGIRADGGIVYSAIRTCTVQGPEAVGTPRIEHVSRTLLPPPVLAWANNHNVKFKVWFGNYADFATPGMKKKALTFTIKDPFQNEGVFMKQLTAGQWKAIRRVVGDTAGQTVFWYIESWDAIKRYNRSEVMSFILTE